MCVRTFLYHRKEESEKIFRPDFHASGSELGCGEERQEAEQRLLNSTSSDWCTDRPSELDLHVRIRGIPDDGYGDSNIIEHEEAAEA